EILHSADTFEWFGEEGKRAYGQLIPQSQPGKRHVTLKHPVGVVAAISPWNFPITLQSRKIAPALAVGCTIVCRPASQTPLSLVLGGHAPFIVFPDADPEIGAKIAVTGKFRNNGQVCIAPSRFYVHKDVEKKFTEATVEFARCLKLGNGLEPGVEVGPMFEKRNLDQTIDLVEDAKK